MREELSQEPVATTNPHFWAAIQEALSGGGELFFLKRLNRCGGAKQAYHVRSGEDADTILQLSKPGDSISVFSPTAFPVRGRTGESLYKSALVYADSQGVMKDWVAAVILGRGTEPAEFEYVSTPDEIRTWLDEHAGSEIAIGAMDFTKSNCDEVLTAYVPDPDGVIRPGAY